MQFHNFLRLNIFDLNKALKFFFLIGHVTKEGAIAGPRILEVHASSKLLWRCCGLVGLWIAQCGQWKLLANDWSSVDDWADHSGFRSSAAGTHTGGRQARVSGLY